MIRTYMTWEFVTAEKAEVVAATAHLAAKEGWTGEYLVKRLVPLFLPGPYAGDEIDPTTEEERAFAALWRAMGEERPK